jgi:hypothetical protein
MLAARQRRRTQAILSLATLALGLYAVLVYRPLSHRAAALDEPLRTLWLKVADATLDAGEPGGAELSRIDAALQQAQSSLAALDRARAMLEARLDPGEELIQRLRAPFRLVEFQNERQLVIEDLTRLARQHQVKLEPGVAAGLPEYTADRTDPELLWAQLSLLHQTLVAAVLNNVTSLQVVQSPRIELRRSASGTLAEIPVELELTGPAPAAARLLETLPLRSDELQARGLPVGPGHKPACFIDRIDLRKESRGKLDDVRLRLRVCSYVQIQGE